MLTYHQVRRIFITTVQIIVVAMFFYSCSDKKIMFQQLGADATGINFSNIVKDDTSLNLLTYPYLYNGAGVGIGDFNNDGKEDIFFTGNRKASNKLYINKGDFKFEDQTEAAGIKGKSDWCNGVSVVDINADGWPDIYISTVTIPSKLSSTNELYINNKNGGFTEAAEAYGLNFRSLTTQTSFFDYDNDGDLDCYLLNHSPTYLENFRTSKDRYITDDTLGHRLFRNDKGKFIDVTAAAGIYNNKISYGLGISTGDINNDGWADIYVSNDFKENDYCYINNGNGSFSEKVADMFTHITRFSMGNDMADYNNDGWPDLITLDMLSENEKVLKSSVADDDMQTYDYKHQLGFHYQYSKNCLQKNIDGKFFADVSFQSGVAASDWSWAPLFADFDNDGHKDLYISNGYKFRLNDLDYINFVNETAAENQQKGVRHNLLELSRKAPVGIVPDYFFLNNNTGGFKNISVDAGFTKPSLSNGAAYADLDNDGDLDLVVNRIDEPAGIYKNNMKTGNYLKIKLSGTGSNTCGIGASVYVFTNKGMQLYSQSPVRGFMSSVSSILNIGLGEANVADSIIIVWPDGKGQRLENIKANELITISQQAATASIVKPILKKYINTEYKNMADSFGISFIHREDEFGDLNVNALLPHSFATQGPAVAVADVNGDGTDDFYIGGAAGQSGELYIQTTTGFQKMSSVAFAADSFCEDVDAAFFDADNDKDMDLCVVSGGNQWYGRNENLKDRLYINDGKGNFSKSNGMPDLFENKGCIKPCDIDKDGDIDLFVGGRVNARMYGYTPASVILQNNGKGVFTEATAQLSDKLSNVGMVTDACWTDTDKDGWMDLIVVGEWMPVTLFHNEKGRLVKETEVLYSSGWWTCIYETDADNDGDSDYLLGNWGTNSKLTSSRESPLTMYLSDWDNNGDTDPVLTVSKENKRYTFLGKSDLEKRLPYLKKSFLKYSEIAGKTVEEVFGKDKIKQARKLEAYTLHSSLLVNEKGKLSLQPLPDFLQTSPVFSFVTTTSPKEYIAAGNFYDVQPFEGRYDAMMPTAFTMNKNNAELKSYIQEQGAVRKLRLLKGAGDKNFLLIARNNNKPALVSMSK
jgi:enediyne biosynthesis protein E4